VVLIAAVVLPAIAVTWLVTGVALLALRRRSPRAQAWLAANRMWFVWLVLAAYLGVAFGWLAAPIVVAVGAGAYAVSRRSITSGA
jgi:hypothetical protein